MLLKSKWYNQGTTQCTHLIEICTVSLLVYFIVDYMWTAFLSQFKMTSCRHSTFLSLRFLKLFVLAPFFLSIWDIMWNTRHFLLFRLTRGLQNSVSLLTPSCHYLKNTRPASEQERETEEWKEADKTEELLQKEQWV